MAGHQCPECGTPRDAEGAAGPGCACAERAADAVRAEREADAVRAEFDPLRVRPYVTLQHVAESGAAPDGATVPLPRVVDAAPHDEPDAPGAEMLDPVNLTRVNFTPVRHRRRKRSYKGLIVAAAAVTVAGTVVYAGGLFSGDDDDEKALPDRGTVAPTNLMPDLPTAGPTRTASPNASASASRTAATSSASATPSSAAPSSTPSPSTAKVTAALSQDPQPQSSGTLRSGDSGPAVVDLQQRLAGLLLYIGPMDGEYDQSVADAVRSYQNSRHVKGDPKGVYGPKTRRALEAETG
ncbi:putative peptidoglycan binding protein [Streptomyces sp. SLBN-118]|uniref:peptidoglycan-binding domain-containing protein n=1 Tax=Streptomyces sp. SLBN-118 TaxID=2768454 RepID=UPI00115396FC|nr:peptidoglycan-binding domain-containing protein [Streptomyces sp. SLBN-118]TQK44250.1 putative peptidoglycan binding protein [Streptomyces sp. SLBN-118]